jgi:hypothetical protein
MANRNCVAPSEIVDQATSKPFGTVAENIIERDYLVHVGRTAFFPRSLTDFADSPLQFGSQIPFVAFLKQNNPHLSVSQLAELSLIGPFAVPDIMTHDPPGRTEFYEIKPFSPDGLIEGELKVASVDAMMHFFSLPYRPGTIYSPNKKLLIFSGMPLGCKLDIFFHFQRVKPGLVVYEICAEGELEKLGLKVLIAILAATIVILLLPEAAGGLVLA